MVFMCKAPSEGMVLCTYNVMYLLRGLCTCTPSKGVCALWGLDHSDFLVSGFQVRMRGMNSGGDWLLTVWWADFPLHTTLPKKLFLGSWVHLPTSGYNQWHDLQTGHLRVEILHPPYMTYRCPALSLPGKDRESCTASTVQDISRSVSSSKFLCPRWYK